MGYPVSIDCARCGVEFCLPSDLEARRRRDHRTFYCPNGHSNVFLGQTAQEKEIEQLKTRLRDYDRDYGELWAQREELIGALKECPIHGCGWRSRKLIPRDPVAMGRGIERVRHDLLGHFARDHVGRTSGEEQRALTAAT